jgi:hypothetical protein
MPLRLAHEDSGQALKSTRGGSAAVLSGTHPAIVLTRKRYPVRPARHCRFASSSRSQTPGERIHPDLDCGVPRGRPWSSRSTAIRTTRLLSLQYSLPGATPEDAVEVSADDAASVGLPRSRTAPPRFHARTTCVWRSGSQRRFVTAPHQGAELMARIALTAAINEVAVRDPVLAQLVAKVGSAKVLDGGVDLNLSTPSSDEEIIARLSTVRGIGRRSATMYLVHCLRRLDVWPVGERPAGPTPTSQRFEFSLKDVPQCRLRIDEDHGPPSESDRCPVQASRTPLMAGKSDLRANVRHGLAKATASAMSSRTLKIIPDSPTTGVNASTSG